MIHFMRKTHLMGLPIIPKVIHKIIRVTYACDIKPTCDIDSTAELYHGGLGCVFHENVVVEKDVKIFQNVTLGGSGRFHADLKSGCDHPVIKQGAIIYAGACILGPITIGEKSIVGANAVVLQDVPPNTLAVGVPAVIKARNR